METTGCVKLTENADGETTVVLQLAPRSEQLEGIAKALRAFLKREQKLIKTLPTEKRITPALGRRGKELHKLLGYTEQLRIIADELKNPKK